MSVSGWPRSLSLPRNDGLLKLKATGESATVAIVSRETIEERFWMAAGAIAPFWIAAVAITSFLSDAVAHSQ